MRQPFILWLHGLGDTGRGWAHLGGELGMRNSVRYDFPTAPIQPVTCNGGMEMTSWMDLHAIPVEPDCYQDKEGLSRSTKIVHELLDKEVERGTAPGEIVLGGFSQGAAMAVLAGVSYHKPLAGIVGLSGWLAAPDELEGKLSGGANAQTPVFLGHGSFDNVVVPECSEVTAAKLQAAGLPVTHKTYPVQHGSHPAEMSELAAWLRERFNLQAS